MRRQRRLRDGASQRGGEGTQEGRMRTTTRPLWNSVVPSGKQAQAGGSWQWRQTQEGENGHRLLTKEEFFIYIKDVISYGSKLERSF